MPPPKLTRASAVYVTVGGFIAIGAVAAIAHLAGTTFIFPSLGATVFLQLYVPQAPVASPRNAIFGHALGILGGAFALVVTGLWHEQHALIDQLSWPQVLAAAISMAVSSGLMCRLKLGHPPAAATSLIVSLGLVHTVHALLLLEAAVVLTTYITFTVNRIAGIPFPLWAPPKPGAHLHVEAPHPHRHT
jgi:CBS-domain-containing membrane protein